jgi:hypothetical protein
MVSIVVSLKAFRASSVWVLLKPHATTIAVDGGVAEFRA